MADEGGMQVKGGKGRTEDMECGGRKDHREKESRWLERWVYVCGGRE